MNEPLITKYRPVDFSEVLGNEATVKALKAAISDSSHPHSFLLTGPSGIGKTTIARIIAKEVKASILEIDGASHSSVDDVRQLVEMSTFRPMNGENKLYILDECHAISKSAWQALLKLLEEPPEFLYIALCTTELQKVPETIKTRCYPISLKLLKPQEIDDLLSTVCELENWTIVPDTMTAIIQAADGSPRRALSILQAGHAVASRDELAKIIAAVESDDSAVIALCKHFISGSSNWKRISLLLSQIDDEEEAIAIMGRYLAAAMARSEEAQARHIWTLLEGLTAQNGWDKRVQLMCAIGRATWGKEPF